MIVGTQYYSSDMIVLTWNGRRWFDDIEFTWLYEDAQRWGFKDFQIPYEFHLLRWAY